MLKRKAEAAFEAWKDDRRNEALLVMGARQVGKTYLIDEFAHRAFAHVVKFDLIDQADVLAALNNVRTSQELFMVISAYAGADLVPHETVIFIDEVQECREALTLIKYLVQRSDFDYILSGSLLGVEMADLRSAPVGYLRIVEMFPLDFEEFCWANGVGEDVWSEAMSALGERRPVFDAVHERLLTLFHWYLMVGGMPQPVSRFIATIDLAAVHAQQESILALYRYDISKYAERSKRLAIKEIFDQVPAQLDSQTKRFNFSALAPRGTYERYRDDFLWLVDAGVAIPVRNVSEPKRPLRLAEDRSFFKLFLCDVGLLTAACGMEAMRDLIADDFAVNYGAIYENAIAQELHAHGIDGYFFRNRKQGEVDFVVQWHGSVVPIEVKSGKSYKRHSALNNILSTPNYGIDEAIVLCEKNLHVNGRIMYCPVYMAALIGAGAP